MSEERDLEQELKEEKDRYEQQNQEIYDEVTKGNEEFRRKQENEEEDTTTDKLESRGYKGNRESPRQRQIRLRQKALADRDKEGSTVTRSPGQVFTGGKDTVEVPDRDMRTGQLIPNETELDQFGNPLLAAGFEITANTILDLFTPILPLQSGGSYVINLISQIIRDPSKIGNLNQLEAGAAAASSLIPGANQYATFLKGIKPATRGTQLTRQVARGAVDANIQLAGMKLGEGEEITLEDIQAATLFGGGLGGIVGSAPDIFKGGGDLPKVFRNIRKRLDGGPELVDANTGLPVGQVTPEFEPTTAFAIKGQGSFGELPEDDDLSQFLLNKQNRYEVADLSLRNANIDRKSPYYDRLRNAARKIPKFIRRNDEGFLYFDYKLFRDSMESGTRNPVTGKKSASKDGRAYLELFETDLDQLIASGTSPATATTQAFKLFNMKEFHDTFKPAAQILGLTGTRTKGRMDVSNVHHIAALKTVMGLYDQLGFNSPMYKKVNAALKESLDGLGSETENFTRLVGGKADVGSPHYLAHMFLEDATGSVGAGEDFFSDAVLARMNVDDNFRISKARELGKIIADAAKVAEQAQDVYTRVAVAANETDYAKIQQVMDEMLQLDFIKFQPSFSGVNYVAKVKDKAEAGMYRTRNFDELLEDLVELQRAIPVGKPKAIVEILFSPQLRKAQKAFGKVVTKIEEKFGEDGVTGAEMRRILDKFDVRLANQGQGQIGIFEDIDDDLIDSVLNDLRKKKNIRRTRRNQEKYKNDPDIN